MIDSHLFLWKPAPEFYEEITPFLYFDKDGFDLSEFECGLYRVNGINPPTRGSRTAIQHQWLDNPFDGKSGVNYDHSLLLARYGFSGELRLQIEEWAKQQPLLNKLLQLTPKWGIDINIEYVTDRGVVVDVLHYEEDFLSYKAYISQKEKIEDLILQYDFESFAHMLLDTQSEWIALTGDDQNDYRARLFGLERAYKTYKVI